MSQLVFCLSDTYYYCLDDCLCERYVIFSIVSLVAEMEICFL